MIRIRKSVIIVFILCIALILSAFFAKEFNFYSFDMMPYDYKMTFNNNKTSDISSVWFSYGDDREVIFNSNSDITDNIKFYEKTEESVNLKTYKEMTEIAENSIGYYIAAAPVQKFDYNNDGIDENVYDYTRADFGPHTFELAPRNFNVDNILFETAFEERKYIKVFFKNEILRNRTVNIISKDGDFKEYNTDENGFIKGLPSKVLRQGFTAVYSEGNNVYRIQYAIEDYDYFSSHFYKAFIPLLYVLFFSALGIMAIYFIREIYNRNKYGNIFAKKNKDFNFERYGKTYYSKFTIIRFLFLLFGFVMWTYLGKLISQGQTLNNIAIPVFSCPFNLDQTFESSCYYLTHLTILFTRNWKYIVSFLITLFIMLIFGGRILCGFMCPLGFVQDIVFKIRKTLHIKSIVLNDRANRLIQFIKWIWIILFIGFVFTGNDFCDICPNKVFSPALGGWWVNLALAGFLEVSLLVGSFYIDRFWCLMCPMGYILGIFYKYNIFKLKKDCTACTECGGCYEACSMRLKNIYTEREKENVQCVDCIMCGKCIEKCPENNALSLTLFGKTIYSSSRESFIKKYNKTRSDKSDR